jgi:4-amino-4-deoxy-L-arabinose transferase-like glycosyltransferase
MIDAPRRSPAHISAQAAAALPRWALLLLLLAFLLPRLFGHDLWPQDAVGFGKMWSMAHGTLRDWLLPNVAGAPDVEGGPLPYWLGAVLVLVAGPLIGETNAAAAANLFWIPLALVMLWLGVYRLARRDEAQPVAGAFGGEAKRRDYARLVADVAVLVLIGTIGVLLRVHQVQGDGATVAVVSVAVFACSLIEWNRGAAAVLAGICAGALALTLGPLPALGLLLACVGIFWRGPQGILASAGCTALLVAPALLLAAAWPLAAHLAVAHDAVPYFDAWRANLPIGWPPVDSGSWLLRTGAWFLWPLWPLAAWAVYAWRSSANAPHIERPLMLLAGLFLALVFTVPIDEHTLLAIIAPLAVLAAFGATTLRRALDNVVDWFAIAVFSLALLFFWAYYFALQSGAPKAMAASLARLAPGYSAHVNWIAVAIAAAATVIWVQIIAWRILRRPRVLWRGPLLDAAGVTAVWITVNLLFLPAVDYVFSYRSFAIELAAQLRARGLGQGCVQAHRVPLAERAMIAYYGKIRFDRDGSAETCRFALHHESRHSVLDEDPPPGVRGMWELSWEGHRRVRPDEHWRIWTRAG